MKEVTLRKADRDYLGQEEACGDQPAGRGSQHRTRGSPSGAEARQWLGWGDKVAPLSVVSSQISGSTPQMPTLMLRAWAASMPGGGGSALRKTKAGIGGGDLELTRQDG